MSHKDVSANDVINKNEKLLDASLNTIIATFKHPIIENTNFFFLQDTKEKNYYISNKININNDLEDNLEDNSGNMTTSQKTQPNLLIESLDNRGPTSTDLITLPPFKNRRHLKQVLFNLDTHYSQISRNSNHFSGWNYNAKSHIKDDICIRCKTDKTLIPEREKITINMEIEGLSDLLKLINENPLIENVDYNIDMRTMHNIKEPLIDLNDMIGMNCLKDNIVDQIIYYIQAFHKKGNCMGDFMHTVIYGPPGTGKTEIAKIIGKIFSKLGILKCGTFKKVTRADLIAGYLGQTALKTRDVIRESLGGVLFIDEAYALGNSEKRDSFAKECIDTLCEALSDNKDNIMVIIAGYESELKTCFFDYNQGLESRFTWRYKTDDYTYKELHEIFLKKIKEAGWSIRKGEIITDKWFEENMDYFKYYGRDMETLFSKTKICHSRRVFCKNNDEKTKLIKQDLEKGLELYLKNDEVKNRKNCESKIPFMYV